MNRLYAAWLGGVILLLAAGSAATANITVRGTVFFWNGDYLNADGTRGAYALARKTQIQVENDLPIVGDIDAWTDANGRYEVTFKQQPYRPDFGGLSVNVEVRASVLLTTISRTGPDDEVKASCYKSSVRLYPYNGQTEEVGMSDGSTWTINVFVGTGENPDPPAAGDANTRNLKITSWDYDDDGRRTVAGIFMCQICRDEYEFLKNRAATAKELNRDTIIFYPMDKAAYRPGQSPPGAGWIDMGDDGGLYPLFSQVNAADTWLEWRDLRCTMLHEFAHKLMHDVYWTLPKSMPWGEGIPLLEDDPGGHDKFTCKSEELGWVEGWADFLPAAVQDTPTVCGEPVVTDTVMAPSAPGEPPSSVVFVTRTADNIEYAFYPDIPAGAGVRGRDMPGDCGWRASVAGERLFNECEAAAVLWDIFDPRGWEYMPAEKQRRRPEGWPGWVRWYDCLEDRNLDEIWAIIKQEPECLNDETESESLRDSFWTFWLDKYKVSDRTPIAAGPSWLTEDADLRMAHGLKAILHNRNLRHDLLPENDPEILSVTEIGRVGSVPFVEVAVREPDIEDRGFLFYNVAYANGVEPLKMMYDDDRSFRGPRSGDRVTVRIALPPEGTWNQAILLVHDSMEPDFLHSRDSRWHMSTDPASLKPMQIVAAGLHRSTVWRPDGSVWTWGYSGPRGNTNDSGMGKSAAEWRLVSTTPILTDGLQNAVGVAVGGQHSVAVVSDGTAWTWGNNESGAAGIGSDRPVIRAPRTTVNQVPGLSDVIAVAAGSNASMALKVDGTVWVWGINETGCLGLGRSTRQELSPVQVPGLSNIVAIAMGVGHALAADKDGAVWAWGGNDMGQIGDGTIENRDKPVKVQGLPGAAVAVAAHHHHHSMALCSDGTVWEWGELRNAEKYALTVRPTPRPRRVAGLAGITAIAAGGGHFLALDNGGRVWAWGDNTHGQLGDGARGYTAGRWTVAPVAELTDVIAIAAGSGHSVAVRSDGTVWTWGQGISGALGDATNESRSKPVQVRTFVRLKPKDLREKDDAFAVVPFRLF